MKPVLFVLALLTAAVAFMPSEAEAVVCARGVARAGCAGPNGAVAVRKPVAVAPRAVVVAPAPVVVAPAVRCAYVDGRRVCR
jgi:hypothetical protein